MKKKILDRENAMVNLACRLEYVDFNRGTFRGTNGDIAEDVWSVMPAISFRPTPQTVLRLNYRYLGQSDLLEDPPSKTAGFILKYQSISSQRAE
ncbi:hypothetical protein [Maribacter sp. 2304DJ31-5]|uniref:hypothetical protein n=1 Tax=Maribacter sp. 2304DJ31-5 TaxID=3386273 RepID=UPI0039BCA992